MTKFGDDLIQSMQEALSHARGQAPDTIMHKVELETIDAKAVRNRLGLT